MQKIFSSLAILIILVQCTSASAQERISLKDAIQTALKNSYDIKLVENTVEIAKNNNDYGVAGALPTITATANENKTTSTIQQKFADAARNTTKPGVSGTTVNGGVTASFILFNGYRIQTTKERLAALENQSNSFLQNQIQRSEHLLGDQ